MINPPNYTAGISLEQAETIFKKAKAEFEEVKDHYSGIFKIFTRKNMEEGDIERLVNCVRDLLPLNKQQCVREQFVNAQNIKNTLYNQTNNLNMEIAKYLARFKNTANVEIPATR